MARARLTVPSAWVLISCAIGRALAVFVVGQAIRAPPAGCQVSVSPRLLPGRVPLAELSRSWSTKSRPSADRPSADRARKERKQMSPRSPGGGWRMACQLLVSAVITHVCLSRCAGRSPGRYPGSLDVPAHLPAPAAAKPQARREMYLRCVTGTDD